MAEYILKKLVDIEDLSDEFEIDSAGTDGLNESLQLGMDCRAMKELERKNVPFSDRLSRRLRAEDYDRFDYILAMDTENVYHCMCLFGADREHKIHRLLDFTDQPRNIEDPWYTDDFDKCYWDILDGCRAFLDQLDL